VRTYAARQEDLQRNRYNRDDADKLDVSDERAAKKLLAQREAGLLARQALRMVIQHEEIALLALPAGEHIVKALETLGLVEIGRDKRRTVRLTARGQGMAEDAK